MQFLFSYRILPLLLLTFVLSGCGMAQWPPPGQISSETVKPASKSDPNAFLNASAVKVGKGDSVWAISKRHKVPMNEIISANNLKPPYTLQIGQRLILPRGEIHIVKADETLYSISRRYNRDPYMIARINNLKIPYKLVKGQKLRLSGKPSVQVAMATTKPLPRSQNSVPAKQNKSSSPIVTTTRKKPPTPVSAPPNRSGKGFIWPVKGKVVSRFGVKATGLRNDGLNIAAPKGTRVISVEHGVVAYAGNELRGFGNLLLIKHSGGWVSAYAHNDRLIVKRGDKIRKGQAIATVGSTGNVKSPQLHFELRKGKKALDPHKYLKGRA